MSFIRLLFLLILYFDHITGNFVHGRIKKLKFSFIIFQLIEYDSALILAHAMQILCVDLVSFEKIHMILKQTTYIYNPYYLRYTIHTHQLNN